MAAGLLRGALDECEELRARRMVAISILRTLSALHNRGHFQKALTRRNGEGLVAHASEDHAEIYVRMVHNGRTIVVQLCKDLEGFPAPRVSWYNAAFTKLGEQPSFAQVVQREAFAL